jgi:membrane protein implicated in regulation of membrane protease activity
MNGKYVAAGVVLFVAFILNWATPLYNRVSPSLAGLPFFYWWQTLVLVIVTFLYLAFSYMVRERQEAGNEAGASGAKDGGSK